MISSEMIAALRAGFKDELFERLGLRSTSDPQGLSFPIGKECFQLNFMPWGVHLLHMGTKEDWVFDYEDPNLIEQVFYRLYQ